MYRAVQGLGQGEEAPISVMAPECSALRSRFTAALAEQGRLLKLAAELPAANAADYVTQLDRLTRQPDGVLHLALGKLNAGLLNEAGQYLSSAETQLAGIGKAASLELSVFTHLLDEGARMPDAPDREGEIYDAAAQAARDAALKYHAGVITAIQAEQAASDRFWGFFGFTPEGGWRAPELVTSGATLLALGAGVGLVVLIAVLVRR